MKIKIYLKFIFILFAICVILLTISCKPAIKELSKETEATEITTEKAPEKTEKSAETENTKPEVKNLKILPDNPSTSQNLTLIYEFNKDSDESTIKWYKNGEHISNFDNVKVIPKINLDPDDNWYAIISPYNGKDYGVDVTSEKVTIAKGELKPEIIYKIDISLEKSNQEYGGIDDCFIQDEFLYITYNISSKVNGKWITIKGGLKILDVSDKNNLKVLSNIDSIKGANEIFVSNDYAYVLVNDWTSDSPTRIENGITIIDIKDKKNPKILSSLTNPGEADDFFVEENYIYIAAPESGLQIIDIKDKEFPKLLSIEKSVNIPSKLLIKENYAYIWGQSSNFGGLYVVNVSNKKNPYLLNKENFKYFGGLNLFKIENTNLYIINYKTSDISSLKVFSLSNKEKPVLKNEFQIPTVSAADLVDNFLYMTNFDSGLPLEEGIMIGVKKYEAKHDTALKIIDISSNEKVKEIAKVEIVDDQGIVWPSFIEVKNDKVFIMYPVMDEYIRTLKNYISIVKLYN